MWYRNGTYYEFGADPASHLMLAHVRPLINHKSMMILLATIVLASAVILRLLWLTNKLHIERLQNANEQHHVATNLAATGSQESAAELWELHWSATQSKFADYTTEQLWPRLHTLYFEPPYLLHNRIEYIGGRAKDGVEVNANTSYKTLLRGLQSVAEELETRQPPRLRILKFAAVFILPALLLWAVLYHLLVYLPHRRRSEKAASALDDKDNQLDNLLYGDPLTDTGNRKAVTQFLSDLQNYPSDDTFIALAVLDLDYFQQVNDVFGYFAGDAVLKEVANRIKHELREDDQLSRIDSDHFAVVLTSLVAPKNAEQIIDRIQSAIAKPIHYQQNALNVTCTVGAAVQQSTAIDIAELFKLSNQALQQAQLNRRGSIFLLSDKQQQALSRQRQVINTIKNHSPDEIFDIVYQPIINLHTQQVSGCECLLRWTPAQPEGLTASELVPILEMFGDINEVGLWVLNKSLQQLNSWRGGETTRNHTKNLVMSINLSARQLETENFAQQISQIARDLDIPPQCVSLELTETVAIKHLEAGRAQLAQLKNHGFNISLDDFGTGYTSLQYLKNMPASSVKIDQSFVKEMIQDERDLAIVEGAINIAKAIGLKIIAEGIDTREQADCLRSLGCEYGQGFLYAKPLKSDEFVQQLLHRGHTETTTFQQPPAA